MPRLLVSRRSGAFLLLASIGCRPEAQPVEPPPDAGLRPAPAANEPTTQPPLPAPIPAPWVAPQLSLDPTTTEGPKGEQPALQIVSRGLPALSDDGTTYAYLEEQDAYGHVRDTSLCFVDVASSNIRRVLLARRGDAFGGAVPRSGSVAAGRFPTGLRATLEARLVRAESELSRVRWEHAAQIEPFFTARSATDAGSADWELVRAQPELVVQARWNDTGAIESIRVQPGFEGPPRWTPTRVPHCGPGTEPGRAPAETVAVTWVGTKLVVLERGWELGTHDCDGVPSLASFAFVRR